MQNVRIGVAIGGCLGKTLSSMLGVCLLSATAVGAGESEVRALWRGAWVVLQVNSYSACSGAYTDNEVRGPLVSSRGAHRFEQGELARVAKISVKRKKIEVRLDIAEPLLWAHREGPFTLYDEISCRVEMEIPVSAAKSAPTVELDRSILVVMERHADIGAARGSPAWNGRARDPYPDDYEETLARYEVWRVEQVNAAVAAKIEVSIHGAARLVDRLRTDPETLEGFAAGVEIARERHWNNDCERLLVVSESSFVRRAPKDRSSLWKRGFQDGQRLVLFVEVGARLQACFQFESAPELK